MLLTDVDEDLRSEAPSQANRKRHLQLQAWDESEERWVLTHQNWIKIESTFLKLMRIESINLIIKTNNNLSSLGGLVRYGVRFSFSKLGLAPFERWIESHSGNISVLVK